MTNHVAEPLDAPTIEGEASALIGQIGLSSGSSLDAVAASLALPRVDSLESLETFLGQYRETFLIPVELPAIVEAWNLTRHYKVRELIAFDRAAGVRWPLPEFASASRRVGRMRLRLMRPMKDLRLIQRYRDAVELKEADAWHFVVYGIMLATFSLPLRQGLVCYAGQTLDGFISAAGKSLQLPEESVNTLSIESAHRVRQALDRLLPSGPVIS